MKKLVLIRHGESLWNKENKFTGWTDVDLSLKGEQEAKEAGIILKENGFKFDLAFTSYLKRAIRTLWIVLGEMDYTWIPVVKSWKLNERHYGSLQGLDKKKTAEEFGEEQVHIWRRSFDISPDPLDSNDDRNPAKDEKYFGIENLPLTECLKDTIQRVVPYYEKEIFPHIKNGKNVIIAAHGNSLRALVKHLDNVSDSEIINLNIPTGVPLVYEFDDSFNVVKHYYLGDEEKIQKAMESVKNQGKNN